MSPPRFEDGTTGRPLGDDEDVGDGGLYADGPDRAELWDDMSPAERACLTLRSQR